MTFDAPIPEDERGGIEDRRSLLENNLGPDRFAEEWRGGERIPLDRLVPDILSLIPDT